MKLNLGYGIIKIDGLLFLVFSYAINSIQQIYVFYFNMKNKLSADIEYLNEINFMRQDNILHIRIFLAKCFEAHRGQKEVLLESSLENKMIAYEVLKLENIRNEAQNKIIQKYKNVQIDQNNRNILFKFTSKIQKSIKYFYNKLMIVFGKLGEFISQQHNQFQNQIRQLSLQKITTQKKISQYFLGILTLIYNRFKKELTKFINFYNVYSILIDKRSQKCQINHIKLEKYLQLTKHQSIIQSIKYNEVLIERKQKKIIQNNSNPYSILDLDEPLNQNYIQQVKEQGMCEVIAIKMDRILKDLMIKNSNHEKIINKYCLENKTKQIQNKSKQIKKITSITRKIKSSYKTGTYLNPRSSSESYQNRQVIRQTLMEMNINQKVFPQINQIKLIETPSNALNFYKERLNKTQLMIVFRKKFPGIAQENI